MCSIRKNIIGLISILCAAFFVFAGCNSKKDNGGGTTDMDLENDYNLRRPTTDYGTSFYDVELSYLNPDASPMDATAEKINLTKTSNSGSAVTTEISLDGKWDLVQGNDNRTAENMVYDTSGWSEIIKATVPGSVHTAMMDAGLLEDPYYGKNDSDARKISFSDWWYRTEFTLTQEQLGNVQLKFGGVCESCTVYLNGVELGSHVGMFGGPDFDITDVAKEGKNVLTVHLNAAPNRKRKTGEMPTFFGGGQPTLNLGWCDTVVFNCCYGWHYCNIPALGIWQSVTVDVVPTVEIQNPFISTKELDGTMDFYVNLSSTGALNGKLQAVIKPKNFEGDSYTFTYDITGHEGDNEVRLEFVIPNRKLWWPNGYGQQNLYIMELNYIDKDGNVLDYDSFQFGIRSIDMLPCGETGTAASENMYNWKFVINGVEMFMKGAGWCTIDALMRFTTENYDKYLYQAKAQNINILRAWGGGLVETDEFYDLCDEYGLCVLQEWPTAWDSYAVQPQDALLETVERGVLRLRNRASLIMWCGGNEGAAPLDGTGAYDTTTLNLMGKRTIELDGTRPWHRQEASNGSSHDYTASWGGSDPSAMMTHESVFFGEFGMDCFPNVESILKYTPETEIDRLTSLEGTSKWSIKTGGVIAYHTPMFNTNGDLNRSSMHADLYTSADTLESLVQGSQIAQAMATRYTLERARTRFPECTGAIYYKLNDIYPAASWATIDWYGSPKYAYYVIQDSFEPLTSICRLNDIHYVGAALDIPVYVVDDANALAKAKTWTVCTRVYNQAGICVVSKEQSGSGTIDRLKLLYTVSLTETQTDSIPLYIVTEVTADGELKGRNFYYINFEEEQGSLFNMPRTTLEFTVSGNSITVKNTGSYPAINVNFLCSAVSDTFRPSDNFFWLEPGESKVITVNSADGVTGVSCWNLVVQDDTPPSAPKDVKAEALSDSTVQITWTPAEDNESGILFYQIYKGGLMIGSVGKNETEFTETDIPENTECKYTIIAVNGGMLTSSSQEVSCTTPADTTPPYITAASADKDGTIKIHFSEKINKATAENKDAYTLSKGTIESVLLADDKCSVIIKASGIDSINPTVLTVTGIEDVSMSKNKADKLECKVVGALIASFSLDEGSGKTFNDSTGNLESGTIKGSGIFWDESQDGTPCLSFSNDIYSYAKIESTNISIGNNFTIAIQFKAKRDRTGTNTNIHALLAKNSKTTGHFEVYINSDGTLRFYATELGDFGSNTVVDDSKWHTAVISLGDGKLSFYIDGKQTATASCSGSVSNCSAPLVIGNLVSEEMFPFYGLIDNVRIYSTCLEPQQIVFD